MIRKLDPEFVPYDRAIQALCSIKFYKHAHGCPNLGTEGCPPTRLINDVFDFEKPMYVIATPFKVGEFAERMRKDHPEWQESTYSSSGIFDSAVEEIINSLKESRKDWKEEYFPRMMKPNLSWKSSREWYNPRLWQPTAVKQHKDEIKTIQGLADLIVEGSPEARGVNITGLMSELGIIMNWTWPPQHGVENITYRVSLAGYRKKE